MSEGRSPRSVARLVACVRGFYRYLLLHQALEANPAATVQRRRAWKVLPKFLSREEVDALMRAPDVTTPRGLRDRALIELLYATGLRVSELVALRPAGLSSRGRLSDDDRQGAEAAHRAGRRRGPRLGAALRQGGAPGAARARPSPRLFVNARGGTGHHARRVLEDAAAATASRSGSRASSARTCSATRLRPTCSSAAPTCAPSR